MLAVLGLFIMAFLLQRGLADDFLIGNFYRYVTGVNPLSRDHSRTAAQHARLLEHVLKLDVLGALKVKYMAVTIAIMMKNLFDAVYALSGVS